MRGGLFIFLCLGMLALGTLAGCAAPLPSPGPDAPVSIPENWTAPHVSGAGACRSQRWSPYRFEYRLWWGLRQGLRQGLKRESCAGPVADSATSWLTGFDDPALRALVDEALEGNFDLRATAARVRAARARAKEAGAAKLPDISAGLSASRAKNTTSRAVSNRFELDVAMGWEVDLWGRLDHGAGAATAELEGSLADYRTARLALVAEVARVWFAAIEAEQQLRLSDKTVASFEDSLKTIEQQYRRGIGAALDVRLARENLATARSQRQVRARSRDGTVRSLETLLGRYPAGTLEVGGHFPALRQTIPAGLPSELLGRRPDIIGANARLSAREHDLRAARANRLPAARLTTSAGTASEELRNLMDWDFLVWSLMGSLTAPIWKGGELEAQVVLAEANRDEAWAEYATVLLRAFREVESALTAEALLLDQEAALRVAEREAMAAAALALERYRQGLSDIVTLLSTQRREFTARSSLLAIMRERLQARIDLHLALGGGF